MTSDLVCVVREEVPLSTGRVGADDPRDSETGKLPELQQSSWHPGRSRYGIGRW